MELTESTKTQSNKLQGAHTPQESWLPSSRTGLRASDRMRTTVQALCAIVRERRFPATAKTFGELWSEIARYDTYGGKGLIFVEFVRHHKDNEYWFRRTETAFLAAIHKARGGQ